MEGIQGFFVELYGVVSYLIDIVLHVDIYLQEFVLFLGPWIYLLLFLIVFCETGLVITPFLPGDSLLFAGGALAGAHMLDYSYLSLSLLAGAILGDAINYKIGSYAGHAVFQKDYRFLKRSHLLHAHAFYEKHGGKAIVIARFMPIVRTFAPFVAGVAKMDAKRFFSYNVGGALLWVGSLVSCGYYFGNLPFVQKNFSLIIYAIIIITVLPVVFEIFRKYMALRRK